MEVNSLIVIIIAMMVGLVVGFEVGMNTMRRRMTEIIEKAAESAKRQIEEKRKTREAQFMDTWKLIFEQASKSKEKEQKEDGIQSERDI